MKRREFISLLGCAVFLFLCVNAAAQEGYYGAGHEKWHQGFYSKLKRNDGRDSCCNLMDCRSTQSRMVGDHYEVKVDGCMDACPIRQDPSAAHPRPHRRGRAYATTVDSRLLLCADVVSKRRLTAISIS
jgi:hypothetical protein